jgi:hypothetical protein
MRKMFAVGLFVALAGVWAFPAEAGGSRHGGGFNHGGRFHGGHMHGGHSHGGGRVFVGFGFYGGYPYWGGYPYPYYGYPYYGYPYSYPPGVVYSAPTVYTAPPNGYAGQPAQPAIQREVLYPHGKYVLEGDGVNTAYRWVWITNSEYRPSEPPKSDAPAAAPPGPPPNR